MEEKERKKQLQLVTPLCGIQHSLKEKASWTDETVKENSQETCYACSMRVGITRGFFRSTWASDKDHLQNDSLWGYHYQCQKQLWKCLWLCPAPELSYISLSPHVFCLSLSSKPMHCWVLSTFPLKFNDGSHLYVLYVMCVSLEFLFWPQAELLCHAVCSHYLPLYWVWLRWS